MKYEIINIFRVRKAVVYKCLRLNILRIMEPVFHHKISAAQKTCLKSNLYILYWSDLIRCFKNSHCPCPFKMALFLLFFSFSFSFPIDRFNECVLFLCHQLKSKNLFNETTNIIDRCVCMLFIINCGR